MLYLGCALVIAAAAVALIRAMRETDADRALTYPAGSYERSELEGGNNGVVQRR